MILEVEVGGKSLRQIIALDAIYRIKLTQEPVKTLFSRKLRKRIEMMVRGREEPIVIREEKIKLPFEVAEQTVRRIAERNGTSIENEG